MSESRKIFQVFGSLIALVIGLGYVTAVVNLYFAHHLADGKPGLSLRDVVVHFHGAREQTLLAAKVQGSMRPNVKSEADLKTILDWIGAGSKESDFGPVKAILDTSCIGCHQPESMASFRPLTTFAEVATTTQTDTGISWPRLALLSHQHLFGIGLMCFALGFLVLKTPYSEKFKIFVVALGVGGLCLDVGSWWLTKLTAAGAPLVLLGGALNGLFFGVAIFTIWYDAFLHRFLRRNE